jgi:uncharacterized protein (TIGR03086 family)
MPTDYREVNRRAVRAGVAVVSSVTAADLDRPTPCAGWTVADLLAHMTVQHHGFALAAAGGAQDLADWRVRPLGSDPAADYAHAADTVLAAFDADGVMDGEFAIPEITTELRFPAWQAISFHFIDAVVHGWDMAQSLDQPYSLDDEVLAAALPVAQAVPDGERRLRPGASFRPGIPVREDAEPLERTLALLGRSADWRARTP